MLGFILCWAHAVKIDQRDSQDFTRMAALPTDCVLKALYYFLLFSMRICKNNSFSWPGLGSGGDDWTGYISRFLEFMKSNHRLQMTSHEWFIFLKSHWGQEKNIKSSQVSKIRLLNTVLQIFKIKESFSKIRLLISITYNFSREKFTQVGIMDQQKATSGWRLPEVMSSFRALIPLIYYRDLL